MTAMRQALADYLHVRRAMGFKLVRAELLLGQFITYLELNRADVITVEHAVAWATLPDRADRWWHAIRLSMVRGFAQYLRNVDERTQVPPLGLIPHGTHRAVPYLYSAGEIDALIRAATKIRGPVLALSFPAMISVLAVTGMRFGEVIALDVNDFDRDLGALTVREGKFGKSRLLPLDPSAIDALSSYVARRNQVMHAGGLTDGGVLFPSKVGTRLDHSSTQRTWRRVRARAGLVARSGNCRPRIHDLRHSFAVATVLDWYRRGEDVTALLPRLSTYLGHADPKHTYWYLSAAPELLGLAASRLAHHIGEER